MGLGSRVRQKRQEMGMSLKDLAEKTDLTPGFISQVERGLTEPSISSLRRIAQVLGVAIFYFLMEDTQQSWVVRKENRKQLKLANETVEYEMLSPNLNGQLEMYIGKLEPGESTCEEPLAHPGEEIVYILKGNMKIEIKDQEYLLKEEDSIYYFSASPHRITNTGTKQLVFLTTITSPRL